jgi:acetoin utilization protein AcuB
MLVRDRMTTPPITMDVRGSIAEAHGLMRHYDIRRVPVLQKGRLVGIVSWTDLMRALPSPASLLGAQETPGLLLRASVKEIMTPNPITVSPNQPIEQAALVMRQEKIGGLPVVEDGALIGVITESDIFQAFVDLTGVREPGTRLVVDLTGHPKAVAEIAAVADETGLPLASIATYSQDHERLAIVRMATDNPVPLVQALGAKGFRVVHLAALPAAPNRKNEHGRSDGVVRDRQADARSLFGVGSRPQ